MAVSGGSVKSTEDIFQNVISQDISIGDSCYREDSEVSVKKVNCVYKEKHSLKGISKSFALFNNIYVYCLIKRQRKKQPKYRLDLTFFDATPEKSSHISWKLFIAGMLMLLLAVFVPADLMIPYLPSANIHAFIITALLAVVGLGLISLAYIKSYYNLVFKSYASGVPLLTLTHKFNNKNYRNFTKFLQKSIRFAHKKQGLTIQDRLIGEMKDLRRLKNAGVLDENIYNDAQTKILTHKSYSTK